MRVSGALLVLLTLGSVGMTDKSCTKLPSCNCNGTRYIDVDCHNTSLTLKEMCRLCESINHVRYLDLSENGLSNIPASCFKNCSELKMLSLASNNLSALTKQAFTGLGNLNFLNLDNNAVIKENGGISDPNLFEALKSLKTLRIQKNRKVLDVKTKTTYLSNVANGTLLQLQSLYLDGVANAEFGTNFLTFTNLTNISFSGETAHCNMTALADSTFKNVPKLESLSLSHCNICIVDKLTFEPLKNLKMLNISYNMALGFSSLRNVSYGLRNSRSIQVLDYSKVYKTFGLPTQLNRCDVWFLRNTSLKEIRLNSNRMAYIEVNAVALAPPTLEVIYLEENKLGFGPYVFQSGGCLTNLTRIELNGQLSKQSLKDYNEELHIKENNMDSSGGCHINKSDCLLSDDEILGFNNFTFPVSLKIFNLRSSVLHYESSLLQFPDPLNNTLESLDISKNVVYKWTDSLILFDSLKQLNLSGNFCSNISGSFFRNFPNIESLDASHNKIGSVLSKDVHGFVFRYLTSLKTLNISNNWIEKLQPKLLFNNKFLENIDLSFNQIENISFKFEHMKNLSTLLLRQNKISSLPVKLLDHMNEYSKKSSKKLTIDLSANNLDASDCENLEFLSWMINHSDVFVNIETYKFYTGSHGLKSYSYISEFYTQIQRKCNKKTYEVYIVVSSVFIMVSIFIIIGAIVNRYRWRLRYLYYMAKARHNGYIPVRDREADKEYQYDVFISYSTEDYLFVTSEMYNKLDEAGFSLCLHQKDFVPGNDIAENIVQAVRNSRKTLIVLSPAFLESKWCIYEFNMARMESIYSRDGANSVFVVMYEDIDIAKISTEMKDCLESESYMAFPRDEAENPYFWQMLIQGLSCPSGRVLA